MFLGRIITSSKNLQTIDFIDKTSSVSNIDPSIPTLIIGKEKAKEIYGKDKVHILDKEIIPNVFWTYSKMEKRTAFEEDLEAFNNLIIKRLNKEIKYYYFNIFTEKFSKIKKFIKYIENGPVKYIYKNKDHLYIYSSKSVIGFSLRDTDYIGIDREKIISRIKSNSNNIMIEDENFISDKMKRMVRNANILVPYLYFLQQQ